MKRIIPLALTLVVLVSSMIVPAKAAEMYDSNFFNVLDYSTPNDSGGFDIWGTDFVSAKFTLPASFTRNYIDMVVETSFYPATFTYKSSGFSMELTAEHITGSFWRIYGSLPSVGGSEFWIEVSGTGSYVVFRSVKLSLVPLEHTSTNATCIITSVDYSSTINYVPTDDVNYRIFSSSADYTENTFTLMIYTDNWKKFDYVDFQFFLNVSEIVSVSATYGNTNLPISVSQFTGSALEGNSYYLNFRLDVRELDRSAATRPMVMITGKLNSNSQNMVDFVSCSGFVVGTDVNPLLYYFNLIKKWIDNQTSAIVAAITGDQSSGDDFKNESSGLIADLDGISASMDSVERPSMDNINLGFVGDISGASSLMALSFDTFTSVPWVSSLIMASITLALISYILYGKE